MKLVTYEQNGNLSLGLLADNETDIIPLCAAENHYYGKNTLPNCMQGLIEKSRECMGLVKEIAQKVRADNNFPLLTPREKVTLKAPIPRPKKNIFCVGLNYRQHYEEVNVGHPLPTIPVFFTKAPTTVIGPEENILSHSTVTKMLDYEVELAIIIGQKGINIQKENAFDYIFGYTIFNDFSARDLQTTHLQWFKGKSLDTFGPMGPCIVYKDSLPNPGSLDLSTKVNGEIRQSSNTSDLIFDIPTIINGLSEGLTLEPGDIIATGTPSGVGLGFKPHRFVKAGDEIELAIAGIGVLKNKIVE